MTSSRVIGRLVALWRYPVKSMGGDSLEAVDVSWNGLAGDRRWAFIRDGMTHSGFPWLTIRELPGMAQYQPWLTDAEHPDVSPAMVRTPSGRELDVADPELAAELARGVGCTVRVLKQDRGIFDTMPLSILTTQSVASLGRLVAADLDVRRFRPNLLIDTGSDGGFPETDWVGATLQLGEGDAAVRLRVDRRDRRCVIINTDPVTTERDPAILRALARERDACLGTYGTTVQPGRITIGDPVVLCD